MDYQPLDANTAHIVLYADSETGRRAELADAFEEIVEELTEFDQAELATAQQELHEQYVGSLAPPPDAMALYEVARTAVDWLYGREYDDFDKLDIDCQSVALADVAEFAHDVQKTWIYALPSKGPLRASIGGNLSVPPYPAMQGRAVQSVDARNRRERLVNTREGVSLVWPDGSHRTVRYDELAAAICYQDGCVGLISRDGFSVSVEPTLWPSGQQVCRQIRDRVPAHLLLNHGARPDEIIPKPPPSIWRRIKSWGRS